MWHLEQTHKHTFSSPLSLLKTSVGKNTGGLSIYSSAWESHDICVDANVSNKVSFMQVHWMFYKTQATRPKIHLVQNK